MPRGLPRRKLPRMDWRAGGDSFPTASSIVVPSVSASQDIIKVVYTAAYMRLRGT